MKKRPTQERWIENLERKGYIFKDKLTLNGRVILLTKNGTKYVAKKFHRNEYEKEIKLRKLFESVSDVKISVKIVDQCLSYRVLVYEYMTPVAKATEEDDSEESGNYFDLDESVIAKLDEQSFITKLDEKIRIMHQIAGIGHGDLHAGNIVVDENLEPYIIDFESAYEIIDHSWPAEEWMRKIYFRSTYQDFVN
jgi:hypothetical protein